jgi:hypothetical protein
MQAGSVVREHRKLGQTFGATDGGNRGRAATEYITGSVWELPSNCET